MKNYLVSENKDLVPAGGGFFEEITCTVGKQVVDFLKKSHVL